MIWTLPFYVGINIKGIRGKIMRTEGNITRLLPMWIVSWAKVKKLLIIYAPTRGIISRQKVKIYIDNITPL